MEESWNQFTIQTGSHLYTCWAQHGKGKRLTRGRNQKKSRRFRFRTDQDSYDGGQLIANRLPANVRFYRLSL